MSQRNTTLDFLKGMTIVLVVVGHSLQWNDPQFVDNFWFRLIYSFHMPLFMALSGFIAFQTFDGSGQKLFKRFKGLVIPYVAWLLVTFVLDLVGWIGFGRPAPNLGVTLYNVVISPDNRALWFLWVLFLNFGALALAQRFSKRRPEVWLLVFWLGLNVENYFFHLTYLGLALLSWHLLFFLFGYVLNKYGSHNRWNPRWLGPVGFGLFLILVPFWRLWSSPSFMVGLELPSKLELILVTGYNLIVPLAAIIGLWWLAGWTPRLWGPLRRVFEKLGTLSIEIYATHFYFLDLMSGISGLPRWLAMIFTFLLALGGSLVVQAALKKVPFFGQILYGREPKSGRP